MAQFVWLYARLRHRVRYPGPDPNARFIPDVRDHWPPFVIGELRRSGIVSAAQAAQYDDRPKVYEEACRHAAGHVVGLALIRPAFSPDPLSLLQPAERALKDFWDAEWEQDGSLLFLDIMAAVPLASPVRVLASGSTFAGQPRTMFFQCTDFSLKRLLSTPALVMGVGQRSLEAVLSGWAERFGQDLEFPAAGNFTSCVVLQMPIAHAMLCSARAWKRYAVPFVVRGPRSRALGLAALPALYSGVEAQTFAWDEQVLAGGASGEDERSVAFDVETYQTLADLLRRLLEVRARTAEDTLAEAMHLIPRLQRIRDKLFRAARRRVGEAYSLEILLTALMLAGALSNAADLKEAVLHALRVAIPEPEVRNHFAQFVRDNKAVPTRTTRQRAKLSVIVGCCVVAQAEVQSGLDDGGFVVYRTIDSSPQGGYDWVMQGARCIKASEIATLFWDAQLLIESARAEQEQQVPDEAEQDIVERIRLKLRWVQGIPTAVGSGRCSMLHKLHAAMHAERLRCPTWAATVKMWNSTCAVVGDLGTESLIPTFRGNAKDLFGPWIQASDESRLETKEVVERSALQAHAGLGPGGLSGDLGFFDFVQEGDAVPKQQPQHGHAAEPYAVDMSRCVYIAGVLHIVHKATEELAGVLVHWDTFIEELTHVTRLLSRQWTRSRLIATCFAEMPQRAFVDEYASFSGGVYVGRWGSVVEALCQILPLERTLRYAWDKDKFLFGAGNEEAVREGEGELKVVNVHKADRAIRSDLFWGYSKVLNSVGELLDEVCGWAEACPCHGGRPVLRTFAAHAQNRQRQHHIRQRQPNPCPLCTCRAPELAAGALECVVGSLMEAAHGNLLMDPLISRLTPEGRHLALTDFVLARQHIAYFLRQKLLGPWRQLPYVLHGVAHADSDQARLCARRALDLFDASATSSKHHALTLELCRPGSSGRTALEAFLGGSPLSSLPGLLVTVAPLRFVPVTERWIESRHARVKMFLKGAPRASGIHVAWSCVHGALRDQWRENPGCMRSLAAAMAKTRSPFQALLSTGLYHHPKISAHLERQGGQRTQLHRRARRQVHDVIFHLDLDTMFKSYDGCPGRGGH
jgi:hypothetical protein